MEVSQNKIETESAPGKSDIDAEMRDLPTENEAQQTSRQEIDTTASIDKDEASSTAHSTTVGGQGSDPKGSTAMTHSATTTMDKEAAETADPKEQNSQTPMHKDDDTAAETPVKNEPDTHSPRNKSFSDPPKSSSIDAISGAAKTPSRPISRAGQATQHSADGASAPDFVPTRIYLQEQVNDWLLQGMRWIALTRPESGLKPLAQYLISAARWREEPDNQKREVADFHKYWLAFQDWAATDENKGKSESEYQKSPARK